MSMIPRKCANPVCDQVFMVSSSDYLTKFHASYCKQEYEIKATRGYNFEKDPRTNKAQEKKDKKCLDMVNAEKTAGSGMEDGEPLSNLKEEKKSSVSESEPLNNSRPEETEVKKNGVIQSEENNFCKDEKIDTSSTVSKIQKEELNGEDETRIEQMNTRELTTMQTSQQSSQGYTRTDSGETLSLGSSHLSTVLNVEKENSIQSLNESSKLLIGFAKSLVKGKIDDFGEVIQKPVLHEIDAALKCVEGVRNIQKTKLEFLKFSRDLQKDTK